MRSLAPMILILSLAGCQKASNAATHARTPEELLTGLLQSAKAKDWKSVETHIYPLNLDGISMKDALLAYMKEADRSHTGDGSFSEEALALLIQRSRGGFVSPPSPNWLRDYRGDPTLAKLPSERFALLELAGNVNVLVVNTGEGYRLLFWEGMNHLLKK